tara:strand:+ start:206 stop:580 length:375 start_codon:yes stop_codon:yes gene_type:complete
MNEEILEWKKIEHEGILCVWPATLVAEEDKEAVEDFFRTEINVEITTVGCVRTLPNKGDTTGETGGRCDFFFYLKSEDIPRFAVARFAYGVRWWEDVYFNKGENIYPRDFREAYPDPNIEEVVC